MKEEIWESFGVEIEGENSERDKNRLWNELRMKELGFKKFWVKLSMLGLKDSVDRI